MISKETIQQIQSRIDIIDIIGGFVKLKKRGTNYLGNCPFHNERTPSFTVSPAKEIFKCFGCGKSGNSINFLMEHEKYSYVEALRWLATRYNIEIEETETSPEFKALQQTSDSLYIINHFARDFFINALKHTEEGTDIAFSYLKERGFTSATIDKFQLGYSPSARDSFAQSALQAGYNPELLLKTGIVVKREEHWSDNYRGRIIFPIHNLSGKVMGFGARVIKSNDRAPKYINTPENEIYVKSRILYGMYQARTAIDKADECLLVEGYTDVISLHQAGVENAVASGGTSLTQDQLRLIKKYTKNLTIVYDGDSAGIKAALRGLDMAIEEGLNVKLVLIPDGEDPDSYVNKIGKDAFIDFVNREKKDFLFFQLGIALQDAGNDSIKKAAVVNQMAETISKMNRAEDFVKRQQYIRQISEVLKIEESGLLNLVNQITREKIRKEEFKNQPELPVLPEADPAFDSGNIELLLKKDDLHEKALIRSLIDFGNRDWDGQNKVADHIFSTIDESDMEEMFENTTIIKIMRLYKEWYKAGYDTSSKAFLYHDDPEIKELLFSILMDDPEISPKWEEYYESKIPNRDELYREEVTSTFQYLQLRKVKRMILDNQSELEKQTDPEEQLILMKTHQLLKKMEADLMAKVGTVIYK